MAEQGGSQGSRSCPGGKVGLLGIPVEPAPLSYLPEVVGESPCFPRTEVMLGSSQTIVRGRECRHGIRCDIHVCMCPGSFSDHAISQQSERCDLVW